MAAIESLFLKGIALRLHAASLGVYKATGQYAAGETGIVFDAVPQDPDDLITLSAYQVSDDPAGAWRARDPEVVRRLAALELADVGLRPRKLPGAPGQVA